MKVSVLTLVVTAAAMSAWCSAPAQAHEVVYVGTLSGAKEGPPNSSAGTGQARLTIDDHLETIRIEFSFSGLSGNSTAAHIHCCTPEVELGTAGVATTTPFFDGMQPGVNLGVTSGSFDHLYDMTRTGSWNPAFLGAPPRNGDTSLAFATLLTAIETGHAYLNIHSSLYSTGEIRTFFTLAPVPEPQSVLMMLAGLAGVAFAAQRRRV
jgi:hypothetical protein